MKTRKIIAIAAISVVAVFFLAGCDQILENLFPNDTGHGKQSGTNSLTVTAYMWTDPYYATYAYIGKIHIDLLDSTGTVVQSYSSWANGYDVFYDGYYSSYNAYYRYPVVTTFSYLNDGTYKVRVYCDLNGNNAFDDSTDEYYVSNEYWSDSFYVSGNPYSSYYLSSGSNVSANAYIDYDNWEYYSGYGF